jgi:hypothetical protein
VLLPNILETGLAPDLTGADGAARDIFF